MREIPQDILDVYGREIEARRHIEITVRSRDEDASLLESVDLILVGPSIYRDEQDTESSFLEWRIDSEEIPEKVNLSIVDMPDADLLSMTFHALALMRRFVPGMGLEETEETKEDKS